MSVSPSTISDYIEVGKRFRRSINLEKDYRNTPLNGEYIITPTALETIHRLIEGLYPESLARAWTITGPYGVGKSAFAVFLTHLLCSTDEYGKAARLHLEKTAYHLLQEIFSLGICREKEKGLFPILVTARRMPASLCIAESITSTLSSGTNRKLRTLGENLARDLSSIANNHSFDTRWFSKAFNQISKTAKEIGFKGILLIVDELGKLFEYAAKYPQYGDVFVFQELAEYAARSQNFPLLLLGLLHQSFEEYGFHLDIGTRREWAKIQGRFSDIAFLEPTDQVVRMVAEAIRWKTSSQPWGLKTRLKHVVDVASELGISSLGMPIKEFRETSVNSYPLHPLSLVSLPYIFRRFAQNERSLFSYLNSMEPQGFQEFIRTAPMLPKSPQFIRIHNLFDYLTNNFGLGLYRQPQALRLLEAVDLLERKESLGELHKKVIKTVGLLNALGQFSHLTATSNLISFAIQDSTNPDGKLQSVLDELKSASILTFRRYNNSYRIWEGSDIDIEERLLEGERRTKHTFSFADSIRQFVSTRPLIARRHSFETGVLRAFEIHYVDTVEKLDLLVKKEAQLEGKIIVCLSETSRLAEEFSLYSKSAKNPKNLLIAIPQHIGELGGIVTELVALRWVWENTPELRDDRVARREVSMRIAEVENLLLQHLNGLIDPRPAPIGSGCIWFHSGNRTNVSSPSDVSQLLSNVFDQVYEKSPKIRNELVVRKSLSSAASAARRKLIQAMLENPELPLLGIEGFPPERSIYESVLRATSIHSPRENGEWSFGAPDKNLSHNLYPCWQHIEKFIFDRQPQPIPLTRLFSEISKPPYGVPNGLHPILICAFMMAYRDETTLYREGTFLPEPSIADFEILIRRPELFSFAGSRIQGGRASVVKRLAKGLKVKATTVSVVRALFNLVQELPEFAWRTKKLSSRTIALRNAFKLAKSPENFLFVQVPKSLGLSPFSETNSDEEIETFFSFLNQSLQEWANSVKSAQNEARDELLNACGILEKGQKGWHELRQKCLNIEPNVTDPQLLAFVRRVLQVDLNDDGIASVLGLVARYPLHSWSDSDLERFPDVCKIIGNTFKQAVLKNDGFHPSIRIKDLDQNEKKQAEDIFRYLKIKIGTKDYSPKAIKAAMNELLLEIENTDS